MSLKKCDDCGGFNSRCEFSPRAGHYYICRDCGGDCYIHDGTYKGLMQEVIDDGGLVDKSTIWPDDEGEIISGQTTEIDMTNMKIGKMVLRNPNGVEVVNITGGEKTTPKEWIIANCFDGEDCTGISITGSSIVYSFDELVSMVQDLIEDCGVRLGGE